LPAPELVPEACLGFGWRSPQFPGTFLGHD
jgi:hypothetical protein